MPLTLSSFKSWINLSAVHIGVGDKWAPPPPPRAGAFNIQYEAHGRKATHLKIAPPRIWKLSDATAPVHHDLHGGGGGVVLRYRP